MNNTTQRLRKLLLIAASVVLVAGAAGYLLVRQPTYQGKSFSFWFAAYGKTKTGDGSTKADAEEAMKAMGSRAVPFLLRELKMEEPVWRSFYRNKWQIMPKQISRLLPVPKTTSFDSDRAVAILADMGPTARDAVPGILKWIGTKSIIVSNELSAAGNTTMMAVRQGFTISDADDHIRPCISALVHIFEDDPELAPQLSEISRIGPWRDDCLMELKKAKIASIRAALPFLKQSLSDTNNVTKELAVTTLGQLIPEDKIATALVIEFFTAESTPELKLRGLRALGPARDRFTHLVPGVVAALESPDSMLRTEVNYALTQFSQTSVVVPALIGATRQPNSTLRGNAVWVLGNLGTNAHAALPTLQKLLHDDEYEVRYHAAEALWKVEGDPQAILPFLIDGLKSANQTVRWNSLASLAELGPDARPAIPAIIKILHEDQDHLRAKAAATLGHIGQGNREAIAALSEAMEDEDKNLRLAAAGALKLIDPEYASKVGTPP